MLELLKIFVDNIAPILMVAGVGYFVGWRQKLDSRVLGQLVFYIFSPALAFHALYTNDMPAGELGALFLGTALFQLSMTVLSFGAMRVQGAERGETAAVMISTSCLNAGNYGLSVVSFAFGAEALARATVVFISNIILNYTLGVFVASSGNNSIGVALRGVLRVPAVYTIPAALILRAITPELPLALMRPIELLASASIPCMLVLLGLQLSESARLENWRAITTGVSIKMLVAPLIGLVLALLLGLEGIARVAFITQVSMPAGVITLILATEFGLDRKLSLSMILATTLISPLTLSVIIWILQQTLVA